MLRFEIKKVFVRTKNQIAVILLLAITVVVGVLTINRVEFVDENGRHTSGWAAARNLREEKNEWAGALTEDVFQEALQLNHTINHSEQALSENVEEQNKAHAKKQGISDILHIMNCAFSGYRDYNYYASDNLSSGDAALIYEKRIEMLQNWIDSDEEVYTDQEKLFLIGQYEDLKTPFYYEYYDGWAALLQNISTFILLLALVTGFLTSGIFSDEFHMKADAVFFSSRLGRNKGILSKMGAGFCICSGLYVFFVFLYTTFVLFVLGFDGLYCPVQLDLWRSSYNITFLQAYLLIVLGGYVGTFFASVLAMLVSATTRSTATGVIIPFLILCAFPFLSRIIPLPEICAFFPDQLLEIYLDIKESGLVEIGGNVTAIPLVIIPFYAVVCVSLLPLLYHVYQKVEVK